MKMSFRAKRLARQNQRLAQAGKLNLVALMDIFTILVFFLMVNQSEVKVLQSNKDINLPRSSSEQLPTEKVMLTITDSGVLVQGKPIWRGDWQQDSASWLPELTQALSDELNYLASRGVVLTEQQQQTGRALTILGDASTPYALLRQIMAICAATEYRDLSLAVETKPVAQAVSAP